MGSAERGGHIHLEQPTRRLQWNEADPLEGVLLTAENHLEGLNYVFPYGLQSQESEKDFALRLKIFNYAVVDAFQNRTPIDIAPIRGFGVSTLEGSQIDGRSHTLIVAHKKDIDASFQFHLRGVLQIANHMVRDVNIARRQESVKNPLLPAFPYFDHANINSSQ